ncbi:ABC transporter ATP-binding protein [Paracoccus liaowanqingii]|nr:ABC transporter ATP-binding protein [Paracoccus liaowanqingii]
MTSEPLVEMRRVVRRITAGSDSIAIVRDVDLTVLRGQSLAILGASGSGKSSLLELIGTLSRPTSGRVLFDGADLSAMPERGILALRRRRIGFVFQSANLIDHLTAAANVALPLAYAGVARSARPARVRHWLDRVGIGPLASRPVARLSGGERQRVAIARALVNEPDLILADEPTGSLDQATGQEIMRLLVGLAQQRRALVVVTHDMAHVRQFDRVARMDLGRLIAMDHAADPCGA